MTRAGNTHDHLLTRYETEFVKCILRDLSVKSDPINKRKERCLVSFRRRLEDWSEAPATYGVAASWILVYLVMLAGQWLRILPSPDAAMLPRWDRWGLGRSVSRAAIFSAHGIQPRF